MLKSRAVLGVVTACATLAGSGQARAFDIDVHKAITTAAVEQIVRCLEADPERWRDLAAVPDPRVPNALRVCNAKQDAIYRKVALWHFYSNGVPIPLTKSFLGWRKAAAARSFEGFFAGLAERMDKATDAGTIWGTAGAMLHYIQDVAVPAHINPIFHPTIGLPTIICGDNFDGFPFVSPKANEVATDQATCARLLDPSPSGAAPYGAILNDTIASTTAAVKEEIPPALITIKGRPDAVSRVPRTWELFWGTERKVDDRFADYGCGNHDHFGDTRFWCGGWGGPRVRIARTAYQNFAKERHRIAVEASVKVITAAARAAAAKESGTFVCPVVKRHDRTALQMCERAVNGGEDKKCARVTAAAPVAQGAAPRPEGR